MEKSKIDNTLKVYLEEGASMPEQAHSQDVGFDVRSISCEYDVETDTYIYHTGIHVETNIDKNIVKSIYAFPRSSNSKKEAYLTNSVGVIDADIYKGEIQARFKNRTSLDVMIQLETCKRMLNSNNGPFILSYDEMYEEVKKEYVSMAKSLKFAPYKVGDKLVQLVYAAETKPIYVQVERLENESDRGSDGFGSSDEKK